MKFVRLVIALHASHRYGGIPSSNLSAKVPAPTPGDEFALPDGGVLLANICSGAEEGRQSPATFYPGSDKVLEDKADIGKNKYIKSFSQGKDLVLNLEAGKYEFTIKNTGRSDGEK